MSFQFSHDQFNLRESISVFAAANTALFPFKLEWVAVQWSVAVRRYGYTGEQRERDAIKGGERERKRHSRHTTRATGWVFFPLQCVVSSGPV